MTNELTWRQHAIIRVLIYITKILAESDEQRKVLQDIGNHLAFSEPKRLN